mmetsp:Transcript_9801/g.29466  ORF Transcript_9801/g.29466 Transcript_9801/m.29466 type:complete len:331 (+) Transcript_9801:925-1917(+)
MPVAAGAPPSRPASPEPCTKSVARRCLPFWPSPAAGNEELLMRSVSAAETFRAASGVSRWPWDPSSGSSSSSALSSSYSALNCGGGRTRPPTIMSASAPSPYSCSLASRSEFTTPPFESESCVKLAVQRLRQLSKCRFLCPTSARQGVLTSLQKPSKSPCSRTVKMHATSSFPVVNPEALEREVYHEGALQQVGAPSAPGSLAITKPRPLAGARMYLPRLMTQNPNPRADRRSSTENLYFWRSGGRSPRPSCCSSCTAVSRNSRMFSAMLPPLCPLRVPLTLALDLLKRREPEMSPSSVSSFGALLSYGDAESSRSVTKGTPASRLRARD